MSDLRERRAKFVYNGARLAAEAAGAPIVQPRTQIPSRPRSLCRFGHAGARQGCRICSLV
jgi:hypothetical protein